LRTQLKAVLISAYFLTACGSSPEPSAKTETAPAPAPVADHTAALPKQGLINSRVVPDHILDIPKLPGGSLGEYSAKGKKYQLFIVDAGTNQKASFLLLDAKATLKSPEYIAYMGGYAGSDGNRDIYVFAKKQYLAGVAGLVKADADPIAIELASHLN
jgi:hypothetical protein